MRQKPNILLILSDQHRFDCLGAAGNKDILTPNIDILASEGIMYTNCFTSFPICTPARYSLLSGMFARQHAGLTNHCTLSSNIESFPKILKKKGYKTTAIGKMHFTPTYLDVGFDKMILAEQNGIGRYQDDYHKDLMNLGQIDTIDLTDQVAEHRKNADPAYFNSFGAMASNLSIDNHSTTWIGTHACDELQNWESEGNLLMVGFIKPHHPFDPPKECLDLYDAKSINILDGWTDECLPVDISRHKGYFPHEQLSEEAIKNITTHYYASISHIDYWVGEMIRILKDKGVYDNTIIIYTSDHGEYLGFHHMLLKQNFMYDPLVKIPLIIKYTKEMQCSGVSDDLASIVDIAPTILGAANIKKASQMAGRDLNSSFGKPAAVFAEQGRCSEYMIRTTTRKLIVCKDTALFFDLEKDPLELHNSINDPSYREDVDNLYALLFRWLAFETPIPTYLNTQEKTIKEISIDETNASMAYYNNIMLKEQ